MRREYAKPPKGVCYQYWREGQCDNGRICSYQHARPVWPHRHVERAERRKGDKQRVGFALQPPSLVRRSNSFSSRASQCSPAAPPFHPRSYSEEEDDANFRADERSGALQKIAQATDRRESTSPLSSADADAESSSSALKSSTASPAPKTDVSSAAASGSSPLHSPLSSVDLRLPSPAGLNVAAPEFKPRFSTLSDDTVTPASRDDWQRQLARQLQQLLREGRHPQLTSLNASTSSTATVKPSDFLPATSSPEPTPVAPLGAKAEYHKRLFDDTIVTFGPGLTVKRVLGPSETQTIAVKGLPAKAPPETLACILEVMGIPSNAYFVMQMLPCRSLGRKGPTTKAHLLVESSIAKALVKRSKAGSKAREGSRFPAVKFCGQVLRFERSKPLPDNTPSRKKIDMAVEWQTPTYTWEAAYLNPAVFSEKLEDLNNRLVWPDTREPVYAYAVPRKRITHNCRAFVLHTPGVPTDVTSDYMAELAGTFCVQRLPLTALERERGANELRASFACVGIVVEVSEVASPDDKTGNPLYSIKFREPDLVSVHVALPPDFRPLEREPDILKWCEGLQKSVAKNPMVSRDEAASWLAEHFGVEEMLGLVDGDDIVARTNEPASVDPRTRRAPSCTACEGYEGVQVPRCGHPLCNACIAWAVQRARDFPIKCDVRGCRELVPLHLLRGAAPPGAYKTCLRRAFQAQGLASSDLVPCRLD